LVSVNSILGKDRYVMEEMITIYPGDKKAKIVYKNDDRTCQVFVSGQGLYEGFIDKIYSSGKYVVKLISKIKDM